MIRAQDALGGPDAALIVANPVPETEQLDPALHDRVLAEALDECRERGIGGQAVTPFLLDYLMRQHRGGLAGGQSGGGTRECAAGGADRGGPVPTR